MGNVIIAEASPISIHALREEGDHVVRGKSRPAFPISIHALREEGDKYFLGQSQQAQDFYPRPPRGGRQRGGVFVAASTDISIHALREEGDVTGTAEKPAPYISIHALREEGDEQQHYRASSKMISIHALREEGDHDQHESSHPDQRFLSTPSARRATQENR